MCTLCRDESENKANFEHHMLTNHTYTCDVCQLVVTGEVCMEDHILEKHALPDTYSKFSCDDCTFETEDKASFGKHYKEKHGYQATKIGQDAKSSDHKINEKLRRDLKELKNNFERLESMYHDSLEDVNQVRSEYQAKITLANDNFTVAKAENEALKEKIDVLFKLGRSYINCAKKSANESNEQKEKTNDAENIEVIEDNDDNIEDLQAWTQNKMRGFKRVNPSSPPTAGPKPAPKADPSRPPPPSSTSSPGTTASAPSTPDTAQTHETDSQYRGKYCHFFVNTGKCNYEQRTGQKCKFEHKSAPMCNFGISCNRPKCMFTHPNVNGNSPFLGQMRGFSPMVNPWQMTNPWMVPQPNQYQNQQWNYQGNQRNQ